MFEEDNNLAEGLEIAIIGMAGRFPGARNVSEFLENLKRGTESISFFSDEELARSGVAPGLIKSPDYIRAKGVLEEVEYFDAPFFGYTPGEARVMSPQMRFAYECAWEAFEDAGVVPDSHDGLIGFYTGANSSFNWESLCILSGAGRELGYFAASQLGDRDYIGSRTAYKLNLRGPTLSLHTACSTSLVAIHLACQAVLAGECDLVLAGGVCITIPLHSGYVYKEGMIYSADGHVKAFDADASGTVNSDGTGFVVLKRLEYALEDRDHIYAVIKGSAVNNDGNRKIGFMAPSVEAMADAARIAFQVAGVDPGTVTYIETHGTGTPLGDTIEFEGLKKAFQSGKKQFCAIGSVKTNLGHVDAAAGVTSLIKTALSLKHKILFPSLNYKKPNARIDFENSPFYVSTTLTPWKNENTHPLRAGVSGTGIGGTNAFFILEEHRGTPGKGGTLFSRKCNLLLLSAMTRSALDRNVETLAEFLKENKNIGLADAAYTLQVGRKAFPHRWMLVCADVDEAVNGLTSPSPGKVRTSRVREMDQPVIFMFPGQGSQYIDMGLEIYRTESVFREEMDRGFHIAESLTGYHLKGALYPGLNNPGTGTGQPGKADINRTEVAQLVVFIFEYALARLLIHWGITPYAMIGYSLGEYTAACISGVLSLEDALTLVVSRCKLIAKLERGAMLSVPFSADELIPRLPAELSISIDNGPSCVVSGTGAAVAAFEEQLKQEKCICVPVEAEYAIHSRMMDPILAPFEEKVRTVKLNYPEIPYISNVTGQYAAPEEVAGPGYWPAHLRKTVRFSGGLSELLTAENAVFLEVGPGRTLSTLVGQHQDRGKNHRVLNLVKHSREKLPDDYYLLTKIGQLWLYGLNIDWPAFYSREERYRISLPAYSFDRYKSWIEGDPFKIGMEMFAANKGTPGKMPDMADWFYVPLWKQSILNSPSSMETAKSRKWLVFLDDTGLGDRLVKRLQQKGQQITAVKPGPGFGKKNDGFYTIDPCRESDYDKLFSGLRESGRLPGQIVHLWNVEKGGGDGLSFEVFDKSQDLGLYSLFNIARTIGGRGITDDIRLTVVTDNMQQVTGEETVCPWKATILGAVKIIPLEYINIDCRSIDIVVPGPGSREEDRLIGGLWAELISGSSDNIIAFRGLHRWKPVLEPYRMEPVKKASRRFREKGVYLITGGLGGMGLTLAEYLAGNFNARLILVGRSALPPRQDWQEWLKSHAADAHDRISRKIRKVREMEKQGGEVLVFSADAADYNRMHEAVTRAREHFGPVNGVLHAAGIADFEGVIQKRTREMNERVMAPKVRGTLVLDHIFKDENLDFFVLFSSLADNVYQLQFGQAGYIAANEFLESFADYKASRGGVFTPAVNWDDWLEVGMAVDAIERKQSETRGDKDKKIGISAALLPSEGVEAFRRIMENNLHRVSVSTHNLNLLFEYLNRRRGQESGNQGENDEPLPAGELHPRPELSSEYVSPGNEIERKLTSLFQRFFGIDGVGIHDDFFELGGDSLKAMTISAKIHKLFDVIIPLAEFFNRPTIQGLAGFIKHTGKSEFFSIEPVETKEYYPVSSAQKRIYIWDQLGRGKSISYNQPSIYQLEGEFDLKQWEGTFRQLVSRHESLRTSYEMMGEEVIQKVHGEVDFALEYRDARDTNRDVEQQAERQKTAADFIRPFELSRAPLFRAGLIVIEERKFILMVDIHHIAADGMSISILINELQQFYAGGRPAPLKLQYKDFSHWHNRLLDSDSLTGSKMYWLKEFEGDLPVLDLPADYPRPVVRSMKGAELSFSIPGALTADIRRVLSETETTLYIFLLAAYNILLSKYTGQEDIIVGSPAAGRMHEDLQPIVGMFVNLLPMRNRVQGKKSFRDFLANVKKNSLPAYENQDFPFDRLVNELGLERSMSRHPLVNTVFTLQNPEKGKAGKPRAGTAGPGLKPYPVKKKAITFDLTLDAVEVGDYINMWLTYSTELFNASTVKKIKEHYLKILEQVTANLEVNLKDIKISHDLAAAASDFLNDEKGDFEF